jgi:hypothetical protein
MTCTTSLTTINPASTLTYLFRNMTPKSAKKLDMKPYVKNNSNYVWNTYIISWIILTVVSRSNVGHETGLFYPEIKDAILVFSVGTYCHVLVTRTYDCAVQTSKIKQVLCNALSLPTESWRSLTNYRAVSFKSLYEMKALRKFITNIRISHEPQTDTFPYSRAL